MKADDIKLLRAAAPDLHHEGLEERGSCPLCHTAEQMVIKPLDGGGEDVSLRCRCGLDEVLAAASVLWEAQHAPRNGARPEPRLSDKQLTEQLALALMENDYFARDGGGKLYAYRRGVYAADGEARIESRVKALLKEWGKEWTQHRGREVVEYIRIDAPLLWDRPKLSTVNVANGLLDLETGRLRSHSERYLSPVQIPVNYDEAADCPLTREFVRTTFPEDAQELAWEIFAWLMRPDTSIQKAVLFTGEGANGKSTFLAALAAYLGRANVVSLSLQKLETERFMPARLVGKLANICPDLPSTHLEDTSMFKAITGGDMISAEYKHREGFDFIPFCRLVFSANHPPHSADSSPAFFRRWLVVPFTRLFEGTDAVPRVEMDRRLSDPVEQSGILNEAMRVLSGLRRSGFTESETMRQAWTELREATDPLAVWLDRATEENPEGLWVKRELWRAYQRDSNAAGRPPLAENAFARALRKYRPGIAEGQNTINGKFEHVWRGISPREDPVQAQKWFTG